MANSNRDSRDGTDRPAPRSLDDQKRPRTDGVWVLDTETKGTGANMVPLERILERGPNSVPGFKLPKRRAIEEPRTRTPREFKVIDVMTRQVLGDRVDARAAIKLLEDVRSVVDVSVHVWEPHRQRSRMLTFGEVKTLWDHAHPGRTLGIGETR